MARKLRGNTTMDMVNAGIAQRNKPIVFRNSTETYSTNQPSQLSQSSIGDSYNKMVGQYEPDNKMVGQYEPDISEFTGMLPSTNQFTKQPGKNGFYSSMSGLEGASMRLANAASQRAMAEAGYGSGLKRGETANEYGLRDISTAKEYGLRDISTAKEYGLRDTSIAKEYGLKGTQTAQTAGYSSLFEMQADIARQRRDNENKQREQELYRK